MLPGPFLRRMFDPQNSRYPIYNTPSSTGAVYGSAVRRGRAGVRAFRPTHFAEIQYTAQGLGADSVWYRDLTNIAQGTGTGDRTGRLIRPLSVSILLWLSGANNGEPILGRSNIMQGRTSRVTNATLGGWGPNARPDPTVYKMIRERWFHQETNLSTQKATILVRQFYRWKRPHPLLFTDATGSSLIRNIAWSMRFKYGTVIDGRCRFTWIDE